MSGVDATFLYFETPSSHMHVLGTIVVDHSDVPDWSADRVIALIEQRLDLLPPFRRKVSSATLRLHHPFWVDLPHVEITDHVHRVQCPAPGGMAEMAALVADFAEKQLDRSKPLWECLVVEGMADNRAAVVFKVHHCAVDGVGAATILGSLFDLLPEGRNPAELEEARKQAKETFRPAPGVVDVTLHTVGGLALRPLKMARLVPSTVKAVAGIVNNRRQASDAPGAVPLTAPRLPFNGAITAGRVVSYVDVSLADVKAIKAAAGGTFNDAITGICGTAFRRYLSKRGELPDSPLIAVVPVSVRGEDDQGGNRVSAMFTALGTDIEDHRERLVAVRQANQVGKGDQKAIGNDLLHKVGEVAPPNTTAAIARFYSALRLADRGPVVHNVVISNVAGPPFAIHLAGARVVGLYPLGPVLEGPGLNITVVSYTDHVGFGLIACSENMPDLADLAAEFPLAVQELLEAIA